MSCVVWTDCLLLGYWIFFGIFICFLRFFEIRKVLCVENYYVRFCAIFLEESDRFGSRIDLMSDLSFPHPLPFFPYNLSLITSRLQFPTRCYYSMLLYSVSLHLHRSLTRSDLRQYMQNEESRYSNNTPGSVRYLVGQTAQESAQNRESPDISLPCV